MFIGCINLFENVKRFIQNVLPTVVETPQPWNVKITSFVDDILDLCKRSFLGFVHGEHFSVIRYLTTYDDIFDKDEFDEARQLLDFIGKGITIKQ